MRFDGMQGAVLAGRRLVVALTVAGLTGLAWAEGPGQGGGRGDGRGEGRGDGPGGRSPVVRMAPAGQPGPAVRSAPAPMPQAAQPGPRIAPRGMVLDDRFHHDHYYPDRGQTFNTLPGGSINVRYGTGSYFFHGGVWFRPVGARFVVIVPPIGIVVPVLPVAFTTLWVSGVPYYYANGVYYTAAGTGDGYVVVNPPTGADTAQPLATDGSTLPEPIIYPRNGQSAQQTEADRQACDQWARSQPSATTDVSIYQRAMEACMDARGYTLR